MLWRIGVVGSPWTGKGRGRERKEEEGRGRGGGVGRKAGVCSCHTILPKRTKRQQPGVHCYLSLLREKPLATRLLLWTLPVTLMELSHCAAQAGASLTSWALVLRGGRSH